LALYNRIQLPHEKNKILITRNEKDQNFDRISTLKAALEKSNEKSVTPSLLDNNYTPFEVSDYSKLFLDKKPKLSEKRLTRIPIFVESSKPVEPIIRVGENKTVLSSNKKDRDMSVKAEELFKPWKPTSIVQNNKLRKVSTQKKSTAEKKVSTQKVSGSDKVNTRQAKSIIVDPLAFQNELLTKNTEKDLKQNKSNDAQAAQTNIQNIKKQHNQNLLAQKATELMQEKINKESKPINEYTKAELKNKKNHAYSELIIEPLVITGIKKRNSINEFQITFEDNDIESIRGKNSIILEEKINSEIGIRKATILSSQILPTTTEIIYEAGSIHSKIPTLSKDYLFDIVRELNINDDGSFLLVELDDRTEDVFLDNTTTYGGKLYLNNDYKVVDIGNSEYSYVLYVGVAPGNTVLNFKTINNRKVNKIIHLKYGEVYVERNYYVDVEKDSFKLLEEKPLSKNPISLNVREDKIELFNYETATKKISIDEYSVDQAVFVLGSRKYYELEGDIVFGRWNEKNILIPSQGYINNIYDLYGIKDLNGSCLIQVNLDKPVERISFTGNSSRGPMVYDFYALDESGEFYNEVSIETQKLFFLGQDYNVFGTLHLKIEYKDQSVDFIHSYCSKDSYVVEQL
jgi:hypothetical protein